MESATKNRQERGTIEKMTASAFPGLHAVKIAELGEGYFNAAYSVRLSDGRDVILKIAPPKDYPVMTYEKDLMRAEVESMRLVRAKTDLPVAEVLCCDESRTICPSGYFFMSKLDGRSFSTASAGMSGEEKSSIQFQAGRMNRKLNGITGDSFGCFAGPEGRGRDWFSVFSGMLRDVFQDAGKMGIQLAVRFGEVQGLLSGSRRVFGEVTVPRLVHWDLWAGNIFVENGRITGIIDFERCLWADVLMESGFRTGNQDPDFLRGYGMEAPTEAQRIRIAWYDLYLFLIMSMESEYRNYPNLDQKVWAEKKVLGSLDFLNKAGLS